jgi:hypothetical protein
MDYCNIKAIDVEKKSNARSSGSMSNTEKSAVVDSILPYVYNVLLNEEKQ